MRTPVELREDAMQCLRMAEEAKARGHKAALLILAQGWAGLADQMEKMAPANDAKDPKKKADALPN
jgi:hypothetical protein